MSKQLTVCVFAGAGGSPALVRDAETIGSMLAESGCHVFYGGSSRGVMGGLARGFKMGRNFYKTAARMTGVLPESIAKLKHFDPDLELIVKPDMPSRKAVFWECDSFLCLPGGFGTFDELFEILTETKLGHQQRRPIIIYNAGGFYDPLQRMFANMQWFGLASADRIQLAKFVTTPQEAVHATLAVTRQDSAPEKPEARLPGSE